MNLCPGCEAKGRTIKPVTLEAQVVPAHINFKAPDAKCPLNLPTAGPQAHRFEAALSNSFAFGGINAALIVSRPE